jgi:tetratricopeptide (TPR) repeat protein
MCASSTICGVAAWLSLALVFVDTSAADLTEVPGLTISCEPIRDNDEKAPASEETLQQLLMSARSALKRGLNEQAELLFRGAVFEAEHLRIGDERLSMALCGLAYAVHFQGKQDEGEQLAKRALSIDEKLWGADDPRMVSSLTRVAWLEFDQGKCADAERLYRRTLTIREKVLGPNHPDVAQSLNNLAAILLREGQPAEAEKLARRSLAIVEKAVGPEHIGIAANLTTLARIDVARGQFREAENLFKRSLLLTEKKLGPENPALAFVLIP